MSRRWICGMFLVLGGMLPAFAQQSISQTFTDEASGVRYIVEPFMSANFPTGLAFAPDGRLFYNEKITGNVRVISADGELQREPVITVDVDGLVERGLLGIEFDPYYAENGHIWIVYTAAGTTRDWPTNTIARFREQNGVGTDLEIMFQLPIENGLLLHNGGNIRFDEQGYLFYSLGDYGDSFHGQDTSTPHGAIHRFSVTDEGLIPAPNNPFSESSIFAYGFRNPYDIALDPVSGQLWATENGPACDDELNIVLMGFNYGWSEDYECVGDSFIGVPDYMPPLLSFTPPIGISGLTFYTSDSIPEWQNDLFFCEWVNGVLRRAEINESRSRILAVHEIELGDFDCKVGIVTGPDGALYFGSVGGGDGVIYRLRAEGES
jgi:glucose/arabinose dehydrogenase